MPSRLVVIGSGWAGYSIAQNINTRLYDVTIISPQTTCALTPLLASAACGLLPFGCAEESIRGKNSNCNLIRAEAIGFGFEKQVVRCRDTFTEGRTSHPDFVVSYDYLVICPGCESALSEYDRHALAKCCRPPQYF